MLPGGQELIYPEIIGSLGDCSLIHIPFMTNGLLRKMLLRYGYSVSVGHYYERIPKSEAIIVTPPTIIDNESLFKEREVWTKDKERAVVESLSLEAVAMNYSMLITTLNSGDISVEERLSDMGGGEIVCMKRFNSFTSWILARVLK